MLSVNYHSYITNVIMPLCLFYQYYYIYTFLPFLTMLVAFWPFVVVKYYYDGILTKP